MLIIPLSLISLDSSAGEIIDDIEDTTRKQDISRTDYLLTEFRVIVTYIRLLLIPISQNLDYDYPLYSSFFEPPVFLSFLFLICILGAGIYLLRRSRTGDETGRFAAFGIFWFFIALSVESSVIPLQVIYEHRVYLPSVGAFMSLGTGTFLLIETLKGKASRHVMVSFLVVILMVLSAATYARNSVWKSEVSLWEDVVRKSPEKPRGHNNLGLAYWAEGLTENAIEHYQMALKLNPDYAEAHNNLGNIYYRGPVDKAIEHYRIALRLKPDYAEAHYNQGNAYASKGLIDKAIEHYRIALRLKPDYAEAYNNLGVIYFNKGFFDRAVESHKTAIRLKPDYAEAHINIGCVYGAKGLPDKAIEHFQIALSLNPDYAETHYNLGLAYFQKGLMEKARREFEAAIKINPGYNEARQYLNQINRSLSN
jgi:tetratricopeptide (TPR) repeat protein